MKSLRERYDELYINVISGYIGMEDIFYSINKEYFDDEINMRFEDQIFKVNDREEYYYWQYLGYLESLYELKHTKDKIKNIYDNK